MYNNNNANNDTSNKKSNMNETPIRMHKIKEEDLNKQATEDIKGKQLSISRNEISEFIASKDMPK